MGKFLFYDGEAGQKYFSSCTFEVRRSSPTSPLNLREVVVSPRRVPWSRKPPPRPLRVLTVPPPAPAPGAGHDVASYHGDHYGGRRGRALRGRRSAAAGDRKQPAQPGRGVHQLHRRHVQHGGVPQQAGVGGGQAPQPASGEVQQGCTLHTPSTLRDIPTGCPRMLAVAPSVALRIPAPLPRDVRAC